MNKRPGFWPVYEKTQVIDKVSIFKLMVSIGSEIGAPYEQPRRGRPHKLSAVEEGSVLLFCMYFGATHRELAAESEIIFGTSIDQSLISHYMDRVPLNWLLTVCERLDKEVDAYDNESVGIPDSTEYTTDRYKAVKRLLEEIKKIETLKGHIIAKYRPNSGLITVRACKATPASAGDSPAAKELLRNLDQGEIVALFGDASYDVEEIFELCYAELKAAAMICVHSGRECGFYRRRGRRDYDNELRKQFRGIVEGIFGATTVRHGNRIKARRHREKEFVAMMAAFNLRTYVKAMIGYTVRGERLRRGDRRLRVVRLFAELKEKFS